MKLDIIVRWGDTSYELAESVEGTTVLLDIPDEYWVVDVSATPVVRLAGPFATLEEARVWKDALEDEYKKLCNKEIALAAFMTFIEQENLRMEAFIRGKIRTKILEYEKTIKGPDVSSSSGLKFP